MDEALFSVSMLGQNKIDQEIIKNKVADFLGESYMLSISPRVLGVLMISSTPSLSEIC